MLHQLFSGTFPQQALHLESQVQSISSKTEDLSHGYMIQNRPMRLGILSRCSNKLQFNLTHSQLKEHSMVVC